MMRRIRTMAGRSVRHPNLHAVGVAVVAAAAVYLNTDPLPAGSDPLAVVETELAFATTSTNPQFVTAPIPVAQSVPLSDGMEPTAPTESHPSVEAPSAAAAAIAGSNVLTGKFAMQVNVLVLQEGIAKFSQVPDYTAMFTKQERIGGDLNDIEQISLKVRQAPLSIYMKWHSGQKGQQVIYVEGQNEGKMLVKPGGVKGRLTGTLSLDPLDDLAMAQARYPVMVVGLKSVAERIIQYQQEQIDKGNGYVCEFRDDAVYDERPCYRCLVVYASREASPEYRKSEILIDKQLQMPVVLKNYTWSDDADPTMLDELTLLEQYAYSEIKIEQKLADGDFDKMNEAYNMGRSRR
jgi:hypothetical protein